MTAACPTRLRLPFAVALLGSGLDAGAGGFDYRLECGSVNSASVSPAAGLLLAGGAEAGSTGELAATGWFLQQADGGDYLVLRSGGIGGQAAWICDQFADAVASAAELSVDTRAASGQPEVLQHIADAEAVFIAGGDQRVYVDVWQGTGVQAVVNAHMQSAPIGGTSAGMAVLGWSYYAPTGPGVLSSQILDDPYHSFTAGMGHGDFLQHQLLERTITDTHLDREHGTAGENRYGRLFALLARTVADRDGQLPTFAIGAEEGAFLAVDAAGLALAFGNGAKAGADIYLLQSNGAVPETITPETSLIWDRDGAAVKAYRLSGTPGGSGAFNLGDWLSATGGEWLNWYTDTGYAGFNYAGGNCSGCDGAVPPKGLILRDGFEDVLR